MAILTVSFARYLSGGGHRWRQEDYDANAFVKAIKGLPFRGHRTISILGRCVTFTAQDRARAIGWFGDLGENYLNSHDQLEPPFIFVPIPHGSCSVESDEEPRTLGLVSELAGRFTGKTRVLDLLRWQTPMTSSRRGGTRTFRDLYDNLSLIEDVPKSPLVLVDDVITSGNHIRAAEARIRLAGGEVELALYAGETVWEQKPKMFGVFEQELEEYYS